MNAFDAILFYLTGALIVSCCLVIAGVGAWLLMLFKITKGGK